MLELLGDVASFLMTPFDYAVSAFLLAWHEILELVRDDEGWVWTLAIVGTAATIRLLMLPIHLRQVRARRDIKRLEPETRALKHTYKDDPERLAQEQMRILKAAGVNPFLSCLPLVLLGLLLLALYRIIDAAAKHGPGDGSFQRGLVSDTEARSLGQAEVLGARIADTFLDSTSETQVVAGVLVAVICAMHVVAQRQEATQLAGPQVVSGPIEQRQSLMLPALLIAMAAFSLVLPVGVLVFWATSKVWTVVQQRVFRDDPGWGPGSSAAPTSGLG
ncbi:membrane protein insertase YidC [Aeromicrobium sp. NPDC092404]|uniref:membrane protein insertase YidC n=1 Tax=Aeromicrobium sp. NPDC092404 TaxID=3154976 RepID=UPI003416E548